MENFEFLLVYTFFYTNYVTFWGIYDVLILEKNENNTKPGGLCKGPHIFLIITIYANLEYNVPWLALNQHF